MLNWLRFVLLNMSKTVVQQQKFNVTKVSIQKLIINKKRRLNLVSVFLWIYKCFLPARHWKWQIFFTFLSILDQSSFEIFVILTFVGRVYFLILPSRCSHRYSGGFISALRGDVAQLLIKIFNQLINRSMLTDCLQTFVMIISGTLRKACCNFERDQQIPNSKHIAFDTAPYGFMWFVWLELKGVIYIYFCE